MLYGYPYARNRPRDRQPGPRRGLARRPAQLFHARDHTWTGRGEDLVAPRDDRGMEYRRGEPIHRAPDFVIRGGGDGTPDGLSVHRSVAPVLRGRHAGGLV